MDWPLQPKVTVKAWKVVPGEVTGLQEEAIAVMKEKVTLYTAQFSAKEGEAGFTLWSWVYNKGGFRLVGKMRMRK